MKYYRRTVDGRLVETKGPDWDVCESHPPHTKQWCVPGGVTIEWYRGFDNRHNYPAFLIESGKPSRPIKRSDAARIIAGVRRNLRQRAA
jgi:hypothetical protein